MAAKLLRSQRTRLAYFAVLSVIIVLGLFARWSIRRSANDMESLREKMPSISSSKSLSRAYLDSKTCARSEWKQHKITDVRMGKKAWRLAIYASGDIVSNVAITGTIWDQGKSVDMLRDLRKFSTASKKPAVFVDVGANIGWFSFMAANYGYKVLAFEPFQENVARLKHSLCVNDLALRKRIKIFPFALGAREVMCGQWSESTNHGNAVTICESNESIRVKNHYEKLGYDFLGNIQVKRLDDVNKVMEIEQGENVVMKIDTERFEAAVIKGAKKFFMGAWTKPKVVYSEFCRKFIQNAGLSMGMNSADAMKLPDTYLSDMKSMGYGFENPSNNPDAVQDIVFRLRSP